RTAEMDQRRQVLLLLLRRRCVSITRQNVPDVHVQVGGGQLYRMAWYHAKVETVEPTGMPVVPGAIGNGHMVVNAIVPGLLERPMGELVHADGARGGPVDLEWPQPP